MILIYTERSKTERGSEGLGLTLLAGEHNVFLLEREDLVKSLKWSFLLMAYSALFNNAFEDLNLLLIIFYTYVAEIQLLGNSIRLLAGTQSSG